MKKITKTLVALLIAVYLPMQLVAQIGPDYNGIIEPTEEEKAFLDSIPELELTEKSRSTTLPFMADNSQLPYFREPFQQDHASCALAASVAYTFTYEMNRARGIHFNKNDSTTFYPTHFGYNLHNHGNTLCGTT